MINKPATYFAELREFYSQHSVDNSKVDKTLYHTAAITDIYYSPTFSYQSHAWLCKMSTIIFVDPTYFIEYGRRSNFSCSSQNIHFLANNVSQFSTCIYLTIKYQSLSLHCGKFKTTTKKLSAMFFFDFRTIVYIYGSWF